MNGSSSAFSIAKYPFSGAISTSEMNRSSGAFSEAKYPFSRVFSGAIFASKMNGSNGALSTARYPFPGAIFACYMDPRVHFLLLNIHFLVHFRSFGSDDAKSEKERFVEALNSGLVMMALLLVAATAVLPQLPPAKNNVDYFFKLEKGVGMAPQPLQIMLGNYRQSRSWF
ncbi:PB1 domain-containing protein [Abeliophyllum distichum]|uniref:PB1 domain-containing protein n=1 Tax=Abeliophyllum distichum TaxID=126358 RepID=A0ABD1RFW6_9LAMI